MTTAQIESRQERAQKGVLIASRVDGGFRVHSTDNPSQQYSVVWNGKRLTCTCPDFEFHQADPNWRCKHIMAVEPFDDSLPEMPDAAGESGENGDTSFVPVETAPSGEPPESTPPRRRRAPKEPPSATHMIIKRSVSPDGRIDSVSVEFSTPVLDLQVGEIKERALKTLQLQREIVSSFLKLNGHAAQPQPPAPSRPAVVERNDDGLPVFARMLDVGKVNGKWGDRLCIVFDMNGNRTRLFGSPKQLAEHIGAAGYRIRPEEVAAGLRLNLPCQVVTKPSDDGKYVNIERVLAVERQPANGGSHAGRVH